MSDTLQAERRAFWDAEFTRLKNRQFPNNEAANYADAALHLRDARFGDYKKGTLLGYQVWHIPSNVAVIRDDGLSNYFTLEEACDLFKKAGNAFGFNNYQIRETIA